MGKEFAGKEVFIGIASCLALAGGLLFYGMQKDDVNSEEYDEDTPLPELKDDNLEENEEIVKPRIKRKYGTNRNYQKSKTTTKRNRYR
jgi:hypothetical protein